ncbi:16S rRNA (uracil(1498)-N(3))-methyltransferase [Sneathiella glossodoripedis]|uniref:16S rRNA (uracil(1498)-N(3))-methyltransferase n=1 Tax=Sneathiella glossodoripedis TaxID=418853 RepID=UPI0004711B61|nr:16S rRNA (uracil(1498)-N(3))-methyltransferase [Sneathiella glossodoripedis]
MAQKEYSVRLYVDAGLSQDQGVVLEKAQSHYIGTVMRRKPGDKVLLFNGRDGEWLGEIQEIKKNHSLIRPVERTRIQKNGADIELWFAPVKKTQTALIIQKATELGVSCLVPVQTMRTQADRLREDKMYLQAVEAAEQCERLSVPKIKELTKLDKVLASREADRELIFCHERRDLSDPVEVLEGVAPSNKVAILVGPEGGFTEEEREKIASCDGTHILGMGPRILRAETAVVSALTLFQALCGDWRRELSE